MVTSYPHFYLLSDLDPEKDTTHGLIDFLSHVCGEFQVAYWNLDKWLPFDKKYSVWEVEVDGDRILYSTSNSTNGDIYPYRGMFSTRFLPSLGDYHTWKKLENEIEIVPAEQSWSWHINSKLFQNCTITMRPLTPFPEEEKQSTADEPVAIREEGYSPMSVYDFSGIELDGVPVTDGDVAMDFDNEGLAVTLTTHSSEEHVMDGRWHSVDRSRSVQLPAMFTGKTWAKAIENGTMKVERSENSVKLTLPGGIVVTATKEGGNIARCLVEEAGAAEYYGKRKKLRDSFFSYMDDSSYELTISGAPALRSAIVDDHDYRYMIYVQDENKVTAYRVYEELDCSVCKEDGEFKKLVENGVDCAAFKIGLYSTDADGGCEPVIAIFKKSN